MDRLKKYTPLLFMLCLLIQSPILNAYVSSKKVLICGICRNIESSVPCLIKNMEALGKCFKDYRVIIYENNSEDNTVGLLTEWAENNKNVVFVSEKLSEEMLSVSRTEKIARARNKVLEIVRNGYTDYKYFINVDLDFRCVWPIKEIMKTMRSSQEWDCVAANGLRGGDTYWDRYAYRSEKHPFGPELLGDEWWNKLSQTWFSLKEQQEWLPVYSAFGGLGIYKTATIIKFSYSGVVTPDLKKYYKRILRSLSKEDANRKEYLKLINWDNTANIANVPIVFQYNTLNSSPPGYPYVSCCEHVSLHAAMAMHGFKKIYINPKMRMRYPE